MVSLEITSSVWGGTKKKVKTKITTGAIKTVIKKGKIKINGKKYKMKDITKNGGINIQDGDSSVTINEDGIDIIDGKDRVKINSDGVVIKEVK